MGRAYKLYSTGSTTANAVASLRVTKRTKIRCILFSVAAVAGAGVGTHLAVELSKQNTGSFAINDPPETVMATVHLAANVNAGSNAINVPIACDIPVDVGDTLYLNLLATGGTALASAQHEVTIYTQD